MKLKMYLLLLFCSFIGLNVVNADTVTQRINERKKIIVGLSPEFKPFEYRDADGKIIGFDIDIIKKLAEALEVEYEIKVYKFDELIPALEKGNIDIIISGMSRTLSRARKVNFTDPYFKTSQVVLVSSKKSFSNYNDLNRKGFKVGVVKETTNEKTARKVFTDATIITYPGETEATLDLLKNKIDGFVCDRPFAEFFIKKNPGTEILLGEFGKEEYCFAVKKGNFDFLYWLNYFISEMKSTGVFSDLYNYWFINQSQK
jgi:polar amino acid transport system substrate-binding protein